MVDPRPDGTGVVRSCGCFWTTLVLGAMLGAAVFVSTDLREKPLRHRGRSVSALDRKPSRTSSRSLHDRLNRTLQRSLFFSPRKERNHEQARAVRANRPVDETVVDASGGPFSSYGPSTCRSSQSAVCKRCVAASSGPRAARALAVGPAHGRRPGLQQGPGLQQSRCPSSYQWSWNAPLEANDAGNRVPGLRALRGVAALHAPGVEVVAQWRQSNWPALVRHGDVRVRAGVNHDPLP